MRLHHVAVVCGSRENADLFYRDLLGLKPVKDQVIDRNLSEEIFGMACDCRIIFYANERFAVEVFVPAGPVERRASFRHICLVVPDLAGFETACRDAGMDVKRIARGEGHLTFVRDPDGNLFEIKE